MNLLFVCTMNQWRSPTAERVFARSPGVSTRSRGTSRKARRTVSAGDLQWADVVCVMEHKHRQQLQGRFPDEMSVADVCVLEIPDEYRYMDPELVQCLRDAAKELLSG